MRVHRVGRKPRDAPGRCRWTSRVWRTRQSEMFAFARLYLNDRIFHAYSCHSPFTSATFSLAPRGHRHVRFHLSKVLYARVLSAQRDHLIVDLLLLPFFFFSSQHDFCVSLNWRISFEREGGTRRRNDTFASFVGELPPRLIIIAAL